jgi:predicted ATPase
MIYLREISLPQNISDKWPFSIPSLSATPKIELSSSVTFIAGDNGSGKSTLLEALAVKLNLPSVGRADAARDESLSALKPFAKSIKHIFSAHPKNKFFLRSEDFFNFILKLSEQRKKMKEELSRVESEYADRSQFAKNQARMTYAGSISQMEERYGKDLLTEASHGESYLRLFMQRIVPNGLYFLDEPEVPLSPLRQLSLLSLIKDMSENENCQFIIATHSPILLAYDKASIFLMDSAPISKVNWNELESVSLIKDFLNNPEMFIRRL